MKALLALLLGAGAAVPAAAGPEPGAWGVGASFGAPMGFNAKYWLGLDTGLDAGAGVQGGDFTAHADLLFHFDNPFETAVPPKTRSYMGFGAKWKNEDDALWGARWMWGWTTWSSRGRLEWFAEVGPLLVFEPAAAVEIDGAAGVRLYFGATSDPRRGGLETSAPPPPDPEPVKAEAKPEPKPEEPKAEAPKPAPKPAAAPKPKAPALERLRDGDESVRAEAAKELGEAKSVESVLKLIDVVKADASPKARAAAASALGKIKDDRGLDALKRAALADDAVFVRWSAANALGELGDERAGAALRMALQDGNKWVRGAARDSLEKLGLKEN